MLVFIDFEASSLSRRSYPIEVAWVFENGDAESHLIRPAPGWIDWDPNAQAIHGIDRASLEREGTPHDIVARRMVELLAGHDLRTSAPSWDGKWLSVLLRGAGLPRHSLRLRDNDEALVEAAQAILRGAVPEAELDRAARDLIARVEPRETEPRAHRALADARAEHALWLAVRASAAQQAGNVLNAKRPAGGSCGPF
jgi:DNA polymerase III epsilon subunit-like protein